MQKDDYRLPLVEMLTRGESTGEDVGSAKRGSADMEEAAEPAVPAAVAELAARFLRPLEGDMIRRALEMAIMDGKISTSRLQRRLRIGYNRAAEIIDTLTERHVIAPPSGEGSLREVLIGRASDPAATSMPSIPTATHC